MWAWQSHQERSDARVLVQHRCNQDAIGRIPGPPAMGVVLGSGEIDHLRVLLGPDPQLLDLAARQRAARVQDASIGTQQQHHLLRGLVKTKSSEPLAIRQGLPVGLRELLARLRALLRRQQPYKTGRLTLEDLVIDPVTHSVEREGQLIDLTPKEFALLEYLMYHPNQVVTREMIEQHIWNYDFECESNVIDVYVRRLRRKIDAPFAVKLLTTVRGVGYRLQPPSERG